MPCIMLCRFGLRVLGARRIHADGREGDELRARPDVLLAEARCWGRTDQQGSAKHQLHRQLRPRAITTATTSPNTSDTSATATTTVPVAVAVDLLTWCATPTRRCGRHFPRLARAVRWCPRSVRRRRVGSVRCSWQRPLVRFRRADRTTAYGHGGGGGIGRRRRARSIREHPLGEQSQRSTLCA